MKTQLLLFTGLFFICFLSACSDDEEMNEPIYPVSISNGEMYHTNFAMWVGGQRINTENADPEQIFGYNSFNGQNRYLSTLAKDSSVLDRTYTFLSETQLEIHDDTVYAYGYYFRNDSLFLDNGLFELFDATGDTARLEYLRGMMYYSIENDFGVTRSFNARNRSLGYTDALHREGLVDLTEMGASDTIAIHNRILKID